VEEGSLMGCVGGVCRINDLTSERASVIAILAVNLPQVLAAIIVLSVHWNDEDVCDEAHRQVNTTAFGVLFRKF
jgi:hypothetical protein